MKFGFTPANRAGIGFGEQASYIQALFDFMKCYSLLAALLLGLKTANACDCDKWLTTMEAYQRADQVFTGKVIAIYPQYYGTKDYFFSIQVDILIDSVYKNNLSGIISVYTSNTTTSCGFPFELGKSYLLFSSGRRNESRVDICDGSLNIELATERLKDLRQIIKGKR